MIRRTRIVRGATEAQRLAALAGDSDELPAVLRAPVVVRRRDDAPVGPALVPPDLGAGDELRPVGRTLPGHDLDARSGS